VIERGSPGFTQAAQVFNELFDDIMPSAIARPLDASDVAGAIRWVAAYDVPFRARSGGHSYAGYSTVADGVVVDLRYLAAISVDSTAGTATVGAGAELIDVYAQLARRGATIPAGSCPSIGVGGHALGGGFGLAARRFGLTADNLIAVEIVTADGQVRTANQQNDPDLLWALKGGGGGNFGVATNFTFKIASSAVQRRLLQCGMAVVVG
jgi:FAD/FMN-containing dehydrogenase